MKRWSTSALTTLQMCGERFRRQYIDHDPRPIGTAGKRGRAVDKAVTESMIAKQVTGDQPIVEANRDIAATEFEKVWSEGVWLNPEERQSDEKKLKAKAKDTAVDLAGLHAKTVGREIRPIAVQHRIEIRPAESDITILGYLDIVELQTDGRQVIRDTKTKEKAPHPNEAEESQQLTMYALLRMAETGQLPAGLTLDVLWKTPAKGKLKHLVLPTRRTENDFGPLVSRINAGIEAVERGIFVPAAEDSWQCSAKWCAYWDSCPYVRRAVSIQV